MPEDAKRVRDLQGRWVKGVSGNQNGRPHKYAKVDFGDLLLFKNTVREVSTPEGKVMMTREAAVQHRLYQSAMQGNVYAQVFLARRFESYEKSRIQGQADILAKVLRLLNEVQETGREFTRGEERWLELARIYLGLQPRPGEIHPKPRRRRSRLKANGAESGPEGGGNADPQS